MLKKLALIGLVGALVLSGCSYDEEKVVKILLGSELNKVAEVESVEYLPNGDTYYTFIDFSLPVAARIKWLENNYVENECGLFEELHEKGYVTDEWLDRSEEGICYVNVAVVENKLAPYNEVSLLLYENEILLYAAGTENEDLEQ